MIDNDEQLQVVREQLARAESALDSLRHEVLPQSRQMYEVMSESYIEMIVGLRAEVDTYLGIAAVPESADLVISLEGSGVGLGHTSAGLVTRFIDTFRRGLQSAVEILESVNQPDTARRRERWIENICDLPFVGVAPGSVKILLGEPESQGLFSEEERQALTNAIDLVFKGLDWADTSSAESSDHPFAQLDADTRQAMLSLITRLLPPRSGDVQRVSFQRRTHGESDLRFSSSALTRDSRTRIRSEIAALSSETEFAEHQGVIRSVDLDAQTFVLRERPDGKPDLPCEYGADLEEAVKEYLDNCVIVSGSVETSRKTKKSKMSADTIEFVSEDRVSNE